jgi:hypothetical protein
MTFFKISITYLSSSSFVLLHHGRSEKEASFI